MRDLHVERRLLELAIDQHADQKLKLLTWKCAICQQERPDAAISARKVDMYPQTPGLAIRNVKYCNGNPACQQGAENWKERV